MTMGHLDDVSSFEDRMCLATKWSHSKKVKETCWLSQIKGLVNFHALNVTRSRENNKTNANVTFTTWSTLRSE